MVFSKKVLTTNEKNVIMMFVSFVNDWVWRSLVACLNGVQEVAGSIPVTQTMPQRVLLLSKCPLLEWAFLMHCSVAFFREMSHPACMFS